MTPEETLCRLIARHITDALGPPSNSQGSNQVWTVSPAPFHSPVNIVLNVAGHIPTVWVFDPHDREEGVRHHKVTGEGQIPGIVGGILSRAGRPVPLPPNP